MSGLVIAVPVKDPAMAKSRLSGVMDASDRRRFAVLLLKRTLAVLGLVSDTNNAQVAVVTSSPDMAAIAEGTGATVAWEDYDRGLNAAAETAACWAADKGAERLMILPADLAAPAPDDIARVISASEKNEVIIAPSVDMGTNALCVPTHTSFAFQYGPGSARAHYKAAQAPGLLPRMMPLESLRYDIDTSDGLAHALAHVPDLKAWAGK